ncbi:MAG: hypothetical protein ACKOFH_16460 [Chthoniobacterales bacterium]
MIPRLIFLDPFFDSLFWNVSNWWQCFLNSAKSLQKKNDQAPSSPRWKGRLQLFEFPKASWIHDQTFWVIEPKSIQWNTQNFLHGAGFPDPRCRNISVGKIGKWREVGEMLLVGGIFLISLTKVRVGAYSLIAATG